MNVNEDKTILLLYRPGTADAEDPQITAALALAKSDSELARWLEEHCARQETLRAKFRQITVPAGLKEQIISEQKAFLRRTARRERIVAVAMVAVIVLSLIVLSPFWLPHRPAADNTLSNYENQMVRVALSGYEMDLKTNDPVQVQAYLANYRAPSDYVLPAGLQKAMLTGCAMEGWQKTKASMICFRTGRPLPTGQQNDLWLFVVDRDSLKDAPPEGAPQIATVNRLITAVWTRGDKVYFLGTKGDAQAIQQFL